ncbi:MAG: alcohol dehydrogenase catalytic domain-containing protein [Chloroflexota bacterium]|nr:alcohol dehydrogenase catalytic domain-containing protein [Chloroflexota bacterium]
MKAMVIHRFGEPEVMQWEDPSAPSPGPGEVVVKVHSVSVNRTLDLQVREDGGGYGAILPLVLGNDPAGEVAETGEGVESPRVGERVAISQGIHCNACEQCDSGHPYQCANRRMLGIHLWGGYAEYVKVPASNCVTIPDGLSYGEATVVARHFPLAIAQTRLTNLRAGDWALVMGAAGGLGSCIVQVARTIGANIIAGAGADERVAVGLDLGAQHGVNYRRDDLEAEVMRITGGRGVDAVFENVGDPTQWDGAFNSMARGGRLVTVGAHGGGMVTLDLKKLYQRRLQVMSGLGAEGRAELEESLAQTARGEFQVLIDRTLPLSQAVEAHKLVDSNEPLGKVILDPTLD